MGRYTGPKNRLSRREGKDLFGVGGPRLEKRLATPPGAHGTTSRRRPSDYTRRLREKQKVKRMYGLRERQFLRVFRMAQRVQAQTGLALLRLLERRLDNVVFRMGLARTRPQARQYVTHGHVLVDGRRVNIPSYLVRPGQQIEIREQSTKMPDVAELIEHPNYVPGWLEVHGRTARVVRDPEREEMDQDIDERLVIEYYSR